MANMNVHGRCISQAALRLVTDHFRANPAATRAAFARHVAVASARPSTNGATAATAASPREGRLQPRELARLLLDCVPGLSEEQLRYVMTHMSQ